MRRKVSLRVDTMWLSKGVAVSLTSEGITEEYIRWREVRRLDESLKHYKGVFV